jgi:hypothetical protein
VSVDALSRYSLVSAVISAAPLECRTAKSSAARSWRRDHHAPAGVAKYANGGTTNMKSRSAIGADSAQPNAA